MKLQYSGLEEGEKTKTNVLVVVKGSIYFNNWEEVALSIIGWLKTVHVISPSSLLLVCLFEVDILFNMSKWLPLKLHSYSQSHNSSNWYHNKIPIYKLLSSTWTFSLSNQLLLSLLQECHQGFVSRVEYWELKYWMPVFKSFMLSRYWRI